jgi:ribonuclease HI
MLKNIKPFLPSPHNMVYSKIYPECIFTLQFTGCCCKGPTGLAGAGAVILENNKKIWADHYFVSEKASSHFAEYSGLIFGLAKAIDMNIKNIYVESDSILVIKQMNNEITCNTENLLGTYNVAKVLSDQFETISYKHIQIHENTEALKLAKKSIAEYVKNKNNKLF